MTDRTPEGAALQPLLRMIAHDLKGLLGTPGLLLHLAASAEGEDDRAAHLAGLVESFRALDRAVTDLGDLGHAVADPPAAPVEAIDVGGLVEGALLLARPAAQLRRIAIECELAPGPWPAAQGDPVQLPRALERIVFAGLAHAANGSRLAVSARLEDGAVRVRVPIGSGFAGPVPTVRERLAELAAGARELGMALPLARATLERNGGGLAVVDGALEATIPLGS